MGTTEGVSAIHGREEPPQATQQAGPYGGSGPLTPVTVFPIPLIDRLRSKKRFVSLLCIEEGKCGDSAVENQ